MSPSERRGGRSGPRKLRTNRRIAPRYDGADAAAREDRGLRYRAPVTEARAWYPGVVPAGYEADGYRFVPLTTAHVEADYEAFMSSQEHLRQWSRSGWPHDGFTLEENRADLQRHEDEHAAGVAYTYSVQEPNRVAGCVYIGPFAEEGADGGGDGPGPEDAVIRGWLRTPLDEAWLIRTTMAWMDAAWSFPRVWWQTSDRLDHALAACDALGLTREVAVGDQRFRTRP